MRAREVCTHIKSKRIGWVGAEDNKEEEDANIVAAAKKERQKQNQPQELKPVTDPAVLGCSNRGSDLIRVREKVNLALSSTRALLHVTPTTRIISTVTPGKLITQSDRSPDNLTWSDGVCLCTNGTYIVGSISSVLPLETPYNEIRQSIAEFIDDLPLNLRRPNCLPRQNRGTASTNLLCRSTETGLNSDIHEIFTGNAWVRCFTNCYKKNKALSAKHSCSNIIFQIYELSFPPAPQKSSRYKKCIEKTSQAILEASITAAEEKNASSSLFSYRNQNIRTPKGHPGLTQAQKSNPIYKRARAAQNLKSSNPSSKLHPAAFSQKHTKETGSFHYPRHLKRWLAYWFLALIASSSSSPSFSILCQARAAPSPAPLAPPPAYLTSSSSSLPSTFASSSYLSRSTRYRLIHPSQTNESIVIYFSPPSINNLRVNTRQKVSFNFTVQRQGLGEVSSASASFQDTTSTSSDSATTGVGTRVRVAGKGHVAVVVNDAASDPENDQQLSPTTANVINDSNSNANGHVPVSQTGKVRSSNKSLNEGQKKQPPTLQQGEKYRVMIYSDNDIIARPFVQEKTGIVQVVEDARGSYILMDVTAGRTHNFSVEARHIGRVTVSVAVVDVALDNTRRLASEVQAVAATNYPVSAVRGERTADLVFNISATVIAIIISFGIGAVTETDNIKRQVKHPVSLIIGFCCQFIIMPVMAFGIAMFLPLHEYEDIRFGLLCVACVPGGGLGHVAVVIADGDVALSVTLNFISAIAMLGTAPLWIFVLGQYFQGDPESVLSSHSVPVFNFELWLVASFLAYMAGLLIKRLRPLVADAILMWLIKPFLLLASILYITLGVYINMYVFELVNEYALLGAMLLPLCGCVVGALAAAAFRQPYAFIKTIALETSSLNCLVVMVALRYSLEQPDADLAAMIPIWVMFTIPGLFVSLAICNKIKNVIRHYWDNRNGNKKESEGCSGSKAYSVSSSVVSPPGTTTLSAPLVVADGGLDDDLTVSTMSNQKVTVL
ncbi:hypothetical protein EGW08_000118 [Elysia chlorotica]|uniref:Uncharacterized protein n=1 Tax=Elysia chlorotica TaxID=188477 RepID=A0A433UEA1_ELYCH|nr:hypothetical protein EGW08_000118 [Elysia chlorotica]